MEMGEPVSVPVPKPPPKAPPKSRFEGVIKGPAGPLKDWPFLLKRTGKAIDQGGLSGGSSSNAYHDSAWVSGANGEFKFENMPEGRYAIEVLLPVAKLIESQQRAPPAESGKRAPEIAHVDTSQFWEDPEE